MRELVTSADAIVLGVAYESQLATAQDVASSYPMPQTHHVVRATQILKPHDRLNEWFRVVESAGELIAGDTYVANCRAQALVEPHISHILFLKWWTPYNAFVILNGHFVIPVVNDVLKGRREDLPAVFVPHVNTPPSVLVQEIRMALRR
jgi:hypothetical protein